MAKGLCPCPSSTQALALMGTRGFAHSTFLKLRWLRLVSTVYLNQVGMLKIELRSFPAMNIPTHGALRFANSTLRRVNCFVKIS
jgi:hypothetical protein